MASGPASELTTKTESRFFPVFDYALSMFFINRTTSTCAVRRSFKRSSVALLVAAGMVLSTASGAWARPADGTAVPPSSEVPTALSNIGIDQNLGAQVPLDAVFTEDNGQTVKLGEIFNDKRPAVLVMVYFECPMLCTMVLNDLVRTMNGVSSLTAGKDFDVIAISINPNETPELASKKKAGYLREYGHRGDPAGWHFLTGTQENITKVASTVGFRYEYDKVHKQYIHASGIMVTTNDGHLARYFYGIDYAPLDLRASLLEASSNKIGGITDQILLYCFHYDAATGKYGTDVVNLLKIGGILILAIMGGSIGVMLYREKRRAMLATTTN
jgi:protein SCO1/2